MLSTGDHIVTKAFGAHTRLVMLDDFLAIGQRVAFCLVVTAPVLHCLVANVWAVDHATTGDVQPAFLCIHDTQVLDDCFVAYQSHVAETAKIIYKNIN